VPDRELQGTAQRADWLAGRIGDAIVTEVGSIGFDQVSEERIIERAGVSREQFESMYADKTECFLRTYEAMVPEFMDRLAAAFAEGSDWRERLRRTAYASLDYFEEDPARARFTTIELLKAGDQAAALADQSLGMLVDLIDAGRYETENPESVPRSTAEAAVGSIWSLLARKIRQHELADETVVPQLMYIAVLPYLGEEAAKEELRRPTPKRGRSAQSGTWSAPA
jgi:AcrR family transcriptional regulator